MNCEMPSIECDWTKKNTQNGTNFPQARSRRWQGGLQAPLFVKVKNFKSVIFS